MKTKRNYKVKLRGYVSIIGLVILLTLSLGYLIRKSNINKNQNSQVLLQQKKDLSVTINIHHRLIEMINQTKLNEFYVKVREMKLDAGIVELGLNWDALVDEVQVGELINKEKVNQYYTDF